MSLIRNTRAFVAQRHADQRHDSPIISLAEQLCGEPSSEPVSGRWLRPADCATHPGNASFGVESLQRDVLVWRDAGVMPGQDDEVSGCLEQVHWQPSVAEPFGGLSAAGARFQAGSGKVGQLKVLFTREERNGARQRAGNICSH